MADKKRMLRCVVCGAIFPEGTEICPVCGMGPESFVPVDMEEITFRNNTENLYLILGGGVAALSAAEAIRARDNTGYIVMLTDEAFYPYNRPMLTKAFPAEDADALRIHPQSWYEENRIQLYTDMKIRALDTATREVFLENGMTFHYNRLIYALGARCFVPPVPGAQLAMCETIRSLADVRRIAGETADVRDAVVVGGGVLGLEAAWALKRAGLSVTVVEFADRLMPRQLDERASQWLEDRVEAQGVRIRTAAKTERILGDARVEGVRLADGATLDAQLVIFSTGVRANAELAREAGIAVDRAVIVDEKMRTSARNVFACGDCAEFEKTNLALWSEAEAQGRVAGANASDDDISYVPSPCPVALHAFEVGLYATGSMDGEREERTFGESVEILYRRDGRLVGCILLGDTSRAVELTGQIDLN